MEGLYLVADIGGSKTRLAFLGEQANIIASKTIPTPEKGPESVLQALKQNSLALQDQVEVSFLLKGVGVAVAGFLTKEGSVICCPNLKGWEGYPLATRLEALFPVPAVVENDANAAAVGENLFGAGKGAADLVYITVSTGIGAGIISGGRLIRGASGLAGEIGHLKLSCQGEVECGCGGKGCLEAISSGTAIAEQGRIHRAGNAAEVFAVARKGEPWAKEAIKHSLQALGIHIANIVTLLNPSLVVIGGGMAQQGNYLLEPLRHWVDCLATPKAAADVAVVSAMLGDNAALMGMGAILTGLWS